MVYNINTLHEEDKMNIQHHDYMVAIANSGTFLEAGREMCMSVK